MAWVGTGMGEDGRVCAMVKVPASADRQASLDGAELEADRPVGRSGPVMTIDAAAIRSGLGLTAHQLSEFTAALALDVGSRPNYPRYDRAAAHLMTAAQALRDVRLPLDTALQTTVAYQRPILAGEGWLSCAPTNRGWLSSLVLGVDDLTRMIHAAGGRAVVVDLDTLSQQAAATWERATEWSRGRAGGERI